MKVLFISNFYPPAHLGGKEIRCSEVVTGLRARGHDCLVLASDFAPGGTSIPAEPGVRRVLSLEADLYHYQPSDHLLHYPRRLQQGLNALDDAITTFGPDLIFIWGMWNLAPALAARAEHRLPNHVVYSFAGYWPIEPDMHEQFWGTREGSWLSQQLRRLFGPLALSRRYRPIQASSLQFAHAVTCSRFVLNQLRTGGMRLPHAKVVLSGINLEHFTPASGTGSASLGKLKVLYAGGLTPRKGIPVVIEAIRLLARPDEQNVTLTLVGDGHPTYRAQLEDQIVHAGLSNRVCFQPAVPRSQMPQILWQHDALVLPSGTDVAEPLARIVMESMACGLVTLATDCGGSPEMIEHGVDGLLFPPGDSQALAEQLRGVVSDLDLRCRLTAAARKKAEARFNLNRMIDETEAFLREVLAARGNDA